MGFFAQGVLITTRMREYHLSKASVHRYLDDEGRNAFPAGSD
jgi:hypothetical protein